MKASISKYRNIVGDKLKDCFIDCLTSKQSTEGSLIAANSQFVAVSWESSRGCIAILNANAPERISVNHPKILGHQNSVVDLKFSPFRSDLLASGSDDSTVRLWQIPEGGLKEDMEAEIQCYKGHHRRAGLISFNTTCADILASASVDETVHVFNILTVDNLYTGKLKDTPTSLDWNYNGSLLGASSKDKTYYIIDPRANAITITGKGHDAGKSQKFCFANDTYFLTAGFNAKNDRELKLWDMRKTSEGTIPAAISCKEIDRQSGILTPYFDPDLHLTYLIGKGEGSIFVYDTNDEDIKNCNKYNAASSQTAFCMFPKKTMDYNKCELGRCAEVCGKNMYYISFTMPRKNQGYDPDLYPPTLSGDDPMSFNDWKNGANKDPARKTITEIDNKWVSAVQSFEKKVEEVKLSPEDELRKKNKIWEDQNAEYEKENQEWKTQIDELMAELEKYKPKEDPAQE